MALVIAGNWFNHWGRRCFTETSSRSPSSAVRLVFMIEGISTRTINKCQLNQLNWTNWNISDTLYQIICCMYIYIYIYMYWFRCPCHVLRIRIQDKGEENSGSSDFPHSCAEMQQLQSTGSNRFQPAVFHHPPFPRATIGRLPRNILHNRQGEVKLTDFGIAKAHPHKNWICKVNQAFGRP